MSSGRKTRQYLIILTANATDWPSASISLELEATLFGDSALPALAASTGYSSTAFRDLAQSYL